MTQNKEWWRGAVMYQVYPRSFMDSNSDGVGDLPGITDKLDYIASLGVEGIWISPFFHSPMKDFGYDISDYRDVDPIFGKNEDFDLLIEKAHRLGIKVIIDMVLSHTSDKHPWFIESKVSRKNAKADWYVWADAKPDGSPPNNWQSCFGTGAWTFDTRRGQYYFHNFLKEQPDLNFHCPEVQDATLANCRYWLERGVDGLRLDVINFLFCDQELRDNPPRPKGNNPTGVQIESPYPYIMQQHIYDKSQPENIEFLKRLRALMDEYPNLMSLGEIGDDHPFKLAYEYTEKGYPLNTAYNTHMMSGNVGKKLTQDIISDPIKNILSIGNESWPSWAFSNHDVVRTISRWGNEYSHDPKVAKMFLALLTSLRGTIFLYQGEELGLTEADIPFERIQDPWGLAMWPEWKGRDGCRTPMPWHSERKHSGFSEFSGDTWLPIPQYHNQMAVNIQEENPHSPLQFTRKFLQWRKSQRALIDGTITFIDSNDNQLICFDRQIDKEKIFCAFNLGPEDREIPIGAPSQKAKLKGFEFIVGDFKE
jgi:alpha-glucosidase